MISTSDSLKRIAWAYGCTKKGTPLEREMRDILLRKVQQMLVEPAPVQPPVVVEMS